VVYKTQSGKNLLARKPVINNNGLNISMQEEIRQAVTYAEYACDQPLYQGRSVGTGNTAYNLALADYLGKPQVLDIDIRGWTGEIGQSILIKATDNFWVLSLCLVIRDGNTILEEGEAGQSTQDGLLWKYTTRTPIVRKPGIYLDAYAHDLPGNAGEYHLVLR
jgi:hypothetical protein